MADLNELIKVIILLVTAIKTSNYPDVQVLLQKLLYLFEKLQIARQNASPRLLENWHYIESVCTLWKVDLQIRSLLMSYNWGHMSQDRDKPSSVPVPLFVVDTDDSDDSIRLSDATAAALQEFYLEQNAEEERLNLAYMGNVDDFHPSADWQLSQFWYDDRTADVLAREALAAAGDHGSIACVSSPTVYKRIRELKSSAVEVKCLEYDQRFKMYGQDFIFFDFNDPLNLDISLKNHFDVVIADPPFLSEECLTKAAIAIKFLAKDKIILCTGAIMEGLAFQILQVVPCEFRPSHQQRLENKFLCYTNYESESLQEQH